MCSQCFLDLQRGQEWIYEHKLIGPIYELIGLFGPAWAFVSVMNAAVNVHYGVLLMGEWWYFTMSAVGCVSFAFILFFFAPAVVDPVKEYQEKYQRRWQHLSDTRCITPLVLFFKFMDGFGRIWAFFSAFQALVSMIMGGDQWFTNNWWFWFIVSFSVTVGAICLANWLLKTIRFGYVDEGSGDSDYPTSPSTDSYLGPTRLDSPVSGYVGESNILSFRAYQIVKLNRLFLLPLYFFQFQNGFGRMWAFFALINSLCAVSGVKLESYPMNWTSADAGWYMIFAMVVASISGIITLIQGVASRHKVNKLESSLLESNRVVENGDASYRF